MTKEDSKSVSSAEAHPEDPAPTSPPEQGRSQGTARETPDDRYFARYGNFLVASDAEKSDVESAFRSLWDALKGDSRVAHIADPDLRIPWSMRFEIYPLGPTYPVSDLLTGGDQLTGFRFNTPLQFKIHVPEKNQPRFRHEDDIPSDDYWVSWDGVTAVVLWGRQVGEEFPPHSGGHVVVDVLRDAAASAGMQLIVQACSPGCTNLFAHRVMRIDRFRGGEPSVRYKAWGFPNVNVHLHVGGDTQDVVNFLGSDIANPGLYFARFKNISRRILVLDDFARDQVSELLSRDYFELNLAQRNVLVRLGHAIAGFFRSVVGNGKRKRSEWLMSTLWLSVSSIETLNRDWSKAYRAFKNASIKGHRGDLFNLDIRGDVKDVRALDTKFLRDAVKQKSSRFDSRAIGWATLLGALVAAAVGLIAGLIGK